jgi:hypothetical protein
VVLTGLTLGASALSIAAAVAGNGATQAVLADRVDGYAQTLDAAHSEALTFSPLILQASATSAGFEVMASQEAGGNLGSGAGEGPRYAEMMSTAAAFDRMSEGLTALEATAAEERAKGDLAIANLREAAATGNQPAFIAATVALGSAVSGLNAIDARPITLAGMVTSDASGEVSMDAQTERFQAEAAVVLAERESVPVPTFAPFSVFDAVRWEAFGAALHGVIVAASVDLLPLLALMIVMLTGADPMLRDAPREKPLRRSGASRNADIREEEADARVGSKPRLVAGE